MGRLLPEGGTELDLSGPAFQLPDDETKITLLMLAAAGGHTDVVRMILERAPNTTVDSVDVRGFTALFVAAMFHHAEIVRLLAGRGANVNFASLGFTTPLTEATKPQSPVQLADDPDGVRQRKAVRTLLRLGAGTFLPAPCPPAPLPRTTLSNTVICHKNTLGELNLITPDPSTLLPSQPPTPSTTAARPRSSAPAPANTSGSARRSWTAARTSTTPARRPATPTSTSRRS